MSLLVRRVGPGPLAVGGGMDQGAPTDLAGPLASVPLQLSQLEYLGTERGARDSWWHFYPQEWMRGRSPGEGPVGMGGLLGKVMIP